MQYGYFTMPLHPPGSDFTQTVAADLQQIVTLDQLGFHEAWIGEHFHGRLGEHPGAGTCLLPTRSVAPSRSSSAPASPAFRTTTR